MYFMNIFKIIYIKNSKLNLNQILRGLENGSWESRSISYIEI